ncbi:MAG: lipopolysaccharide biosynthesis protein [Gracilimonas sp.]|uniref:Lipopolysaccharide biosynthesis protein n=1 Tax=Gracilimonas sediminicola TaxID=2952158 RepID=A0A9X2L0R1_9BACT|nr:MULTISPECIES: lipopolysaccharide biosynthesis protein [Gracilimonas]MBO6586677.1 lipopolysaccharide biosynthesis protein [Gracilimonas sp.]MBO6615334.1 lipopolysaccharide biosynthesis protein [Gracilimonas sp.]MCP9290165.1 lipopolysaccharide biosynthesis protein [Gracilimonas sediminicola]
MSESSFARRVASSVLYSGVGSVTARLLNAVALFYTLKVISEEQFGIAALALAFFSTTKALTELGLGTALVQEKRIGRTQVDSLFWISFLLSVVVYGLIYLGAPFVASFYDTPVLSSMIRVYMLGIIAFSFYMISSKLMMRDLEFKKLAISDNVALASSAGLMIYLAYTGWGAWAIILAELANKVGQMVFCMFFKPYWPRFHYDHGKVKHLIEFGMFTTGSNFFQKFYMNADYLIIGKFFSMELVGIYSFAYRLVFDTVKELSNVINRVAYPAFAKLQNQIPRLRNYFFTMSRASMLLVGTVMVIIGTYIDWFLPLVGYEKWMDAVPYMRIFVAVGIIQCLVTLLPKLINAKGEARFIFYFTSANAILLPAGFLIASQISMMAVALVWLTVYPLVSLVIIYFGAKLTETNVWRFGLKSISAFATLIPLAGFAYAVRYGITTFYGEATIGAVALAAIFVFSITASVIWFREKDAIQAIRK